MFIKVLGDFIKASKKLPPDGNRIPPGGKDNKLKTFFQQNRRYFLQTVVKRLNQKPWSNRRTTEG